MDTRIQKHTPPRTALRCFRKSPENWPWLLWLLWWLSLSPITAIISGAFPCALLSVQRSVYPNVSCGGHSREASSINTLLSLTPSLIFSPFYHSRSFPRLSMVSLAEIGKGTGCILLCVCFGGPWLFGIQSCADASFFWSCTVVQ